MGLSSTLFRKSIQWRICERDAAVKLCRQDVTIIPSDSCFLRMVLSRAWCL